MYVSDPLLRPDVVEDRQYQAGLAESLAARSQLLVLPTGLGKTVVLLRVMIRFLHRWPGRKILVLAPTKPLCDQHVAFFRKALRDIPVAGFTGDVTPAQRDDRWGAARVVVATPQVIQNDLVRGTRSLEDVSLVAYDEAHRATGRYPYVFIAARYAQVPDGHAIGLTASPGNDPAAIRVLLRALDLQGVEIRRESDADVAPYVHKVDTQWAKVRPSLANDRVTRLLERMYGRCILAIHRLGHLRQVRGLPGRKDLLALGARLRANLGSGGAGRAEYEGLSLQARALKLQHAIELSETQGTQFVASFLERIAQEAAVAGASRAARDIVREAEFSEALRLARSDSEPSPKAARIRSIVQEALGRGETRVLVFANYRETADELVTVLSSLDGARVSRFVGHGNRGSRRGQTKREQSHVVEQFRNGDLNVLVATSVGEEGLDLPETDTVVLHEPVPSAIRLVQRRGRTGRHARGRVVILLAEGTRDESYHWASVRRQRAMNGDLDRLRGLRPIEAVAARVESRAEAAGTLAITIDTRESGSALAQFLVMRGLRVRTEPLPTGDYAVSDRVLVERKSVKDLAASVRDGRLWDQLPRLARAGTGILLVEGDPFSGEAGLTRAAMAGALAKASRMQGVSVVVVGSAEAAADYVMALVRQERASGREGAARLERGPPHPDAQLRFVLEGIPGVGPVMARQLLERFGSLAGIFEAGEDALEATPGVGPVTARTIRDVIHRAYQAPSSPVATWSATGNPPVPTLEGGDGPAR